MSRGSKEEIFGKRIFRGDITIFGRTIWKKRPEYYAPVSGEPSLGTWHPVTHVHSGWSEGINAYANNAFTDYICQWIPVGSKAVRIAWASINAGPHLIRKKGSTGNADYNTHAVGADIAGTFYGEVEVEIDSALTIQIRRLNAGAGTLYGHEVAYLT